MHVVGVEAVAGIVAVVGAEAITVMVAAIPMVAIPIMLQAITMVAVIGLTNPFTITLPTATLAVDIITPFTGVDRKF